MEYITSNTGTNIGEIGLVLTISENGIERKRERTEEEKISHIIDLVSNFFMKKRENVLSGKTREYVQVRQVAEYYSWNLTNASSTDIGKIMDGRDHATVLSSIKTIRNIRQTDKAFRKQLEEFESKYRLIFRERIAQRGKW